MTDAQMARARWWNLAALSIGGWLGIAAGILLVGWWCVNAYQDGAWGMLAAGVLLAVPFVWGAMAAGAQAALRTWQAMLLVGLGISNVVVALTRPRPR